MEAGDLGRVLDCLELFDDRLGALDSVLREGGQLRYDRERARALTAPIA